ncbi:MAG: hypothetical protein ACQ9MH_06865 [Nitrospinales bacterium]
MTGNEENEKKPTDSSDADRLEEIKQEEKEDASSYYASGDSHEKDTTESDMNKPIPPVDEEKEEMSLLKAVAYLGFGMAAIAIVFMLFFLRSLDERVLDVDKSVANLGAEFAPFKKEVDDNFAKVNGDFDQLKDKIGKYQRVITVMELKRAMVSIQEVTNGATPEVRAKADDVMVSIKTLLQQLGEGEAGGAIAPGTSAPSFEPAMTPEAEPEAASEPEAEPEAAPEAEAEPESEPEAAAEAETDEGGETMEVSSSEEETEETPVGEIELEASEDGDEEGDDEAEEDEEDEE